MKEKFGQEQENKEQLQQEVNKLREEWDKELAAAKQV